MCLEGDAADVYVETRQRARKVYRCEECGAPIPKGVEYIRVHGLSDGSWFGGIQHVECQALWLFVQRELCGNVGLRYVGGLSEEIREYSEPDLDLDGNEIPGPVLRVVFDAIREGYERQAAA